MRLFVRFVSIIIFIGYCFLLPSYSFGATDSCEGEFLEKVEELHINIPLLEYTASYFTPLIKESFNNNTHYCALLDIGDEALLARVHLVRSAQKVIYIQTYIWSNDETGRFMMQELALAAKRGVKVKIIVDQFAHSLDPKAVAFLSIDNPNLEIKFYNPNAKKVSSSKLDYLWGLTKFGQFNQRMHNKVFIVDDCIAITGGRNYQNDYFDRGSKRNFKDRDVLVVGPAVKTMTDSFSDYWHYYLSVPSGEMIDVKREISKGFSEEFKKAHKYRKGHFFHELDLHATDLEYVHRVIANNIFNVNKIEFIADPPGKITKNSLIGGGLAIDELIRLLSKAEKRIIMQTPYLILDSKGRKLFRKLRRNKPEIDILVSSNSLAAADHFYAYAFSYKYKKFYVKDLKWRIFELKRYPEDVDMMVPPLDGIKRSENSLICIHSKTYIVDNDRVYIGSFNIDPRSANLNTEAGVIIYDEEFTQAVTQNILNDMNPENSWTIGIYKHVPVAAHFSEFMHNIMSVIPIIDIWPFGYTASFKLIEGKEEVPFYQEDFYKNYISAGPFPDAPFTSKEMKARLMKSFFGLMEPIM